MWVSLGGPGPQLAQTRAAVAPGVLEDLSYREHRVDATLHLAAHRVPGLHLATEVEVEDPVDRERCRSLLAFGRGRALGPQRAHRRPVEAVDDHSVGLGAGDDGLLPVVVHRRLG